MIKIRILSPGKIKDHWLEEAMREFTQRLTGQASVEYLWAKDERQFTQQLTQEKRLICLDPKGQEMTSEGFADFFFKEVEARGSAISFGIGGAGWPAQRN